MKRVRIKDIPIIFAVGKKSISPPEFLVQLPAILELKRIYRPSPLSPLRVKSCR